MKNKLKLNFKNKKTIIISILIGLILIGLIIFVIFKVTHKDKDLTPNNPTTNEFENYLKDSIKPFDEDSIKDFIGSTDNAVNVDEFYWGAMYSGEVTDDIKILYALSHLFYKDSNLIEYMTGANMFDDDNGFGEVRLSIKFINKVLNAKFKDTKIEKNAYLTNGFFNGINIIVCDDTECIISISSSDNSGNTSDGLYNQKDSNFEKISNGYEYTTEYYYYEMLFTGEMKFGMYENATKENVYCETSILDIYLNGSNLPEVCKKDITYPKIKYTFDKNYRFISSEKI